MIMGIILLVIMVAAIGFGAFGEGKTAMPQVPEWYKRRAEQANAMRQSQYLSEPQELPAHEGRELSEDAQQPTGAQQPTAIQPPMGMMPPIGMIPPPGDNPLVTLAMMDYIDGIGEDNPGL
jgi:hypothetical protein